MGVITYDCELCLYFCYAFHCRVINLMKKSVIWYLSSYCTQILQRLLNKDTCSTLTFTTKEFWKVLSLFRYVVVKGAAYANQENLPFVQS